MYQVHGKEIEVDALQKPLICTVSHYDMAPHIKTFTWSPESEELNSQSKGDVFLALGRRLAARSVAGRIPANGGECSSRMVRPA